jgi:hypothetical protein
MGKRPRRGCALAAVPSAFDKTARHPQKGQTFHRSRLGKEAGPCRHHSGLRRADGTAKRTVAGTRFPIGPLVLPRLRHGNLPTVCSRLHAHGAGVVLRDPVMEKLFRPLLRYARNAYLSTSKLDILFRNSQFNNNNNNNKATLAHESPMGHHLLRLNATPQTIKAHPPHSPGPKAKCSVPSLGPQSPTKTSYAGCFHYRGAVEGSG